MKEAGLEADLKAFQKLALRRERVFSGGECE